MAANNHRRASTADLISLVIPGDEYTEKDSSFQIQNGPVQLSRESYPHTPDRLQASSSSPRSPPDVQAPSPRSASRPASHPSPFVRQSYSHKPSRSLYNAPSRPPRYLRIARILKPWMPMILYALTSAVFVVAIGLYREDLFALLDELSLWLRSDEHYGHAVLFFLIFLTTIPPIPLYSTLIILSGYTFGPWVGALISYFSALIGALVVFVVSRALFRDSIGQWLNSCTRIKRVVRAIEKRPKLLFLIRFAPYPYNVLNCLLAASPTLTLHTYTVCTALSLFKVIIHTSIGASIHSFKDYHTTDSESTDHGDWLTQMYTIGGIILCAVLLVYLYIVANRAVEEELDGDKPEAQDAEETESLMSPVDIESGASPNSLHSSPRPSMSEVSFSPSRLITPSVPFRSSFDLDRDETPSSSEQTQWS